jgi:hypothetical protein
VTYGVMNTDTHWHDPERGYYTIPVGAKVRRIKPRAKHEHEQLTRRTARGEAVCVVRLQGMRRVIEEREATWDDDITT